MNLDNLKRHNPDFDPITFDRMPHPKTHLFDPAKFTDSELHQSAEQDARELIRSELSKKAGGKAVYSQSELLYTKGSVRGTEIFNAISSGKAVVR